MRRTNIYLPDVQLDVLQRLSRQRGQPVAELVREAIGAWLEQQGVRPVSEDEWLRRFDELLARREAVAQQEGWKAEDVEQDVMEAVREVRRARAARRS
jgi:Ribbon-helix-helix protein, copG family